MLSLCDFTKVIVKRYEADFGEFLNFWENARTRELIMAKNGYYSQPFLMYNKPLNIKRLGIVTFASAIIENASHFALAHS